MTHTIKLAVLAAVAAATPAFAIDGDADPNLSGQQDFFSYHNGWTGFEIITRTNNPTNDGQDWAMPGTFDGIGAQRVGDKLRVQVNHEISDTTISEVMIDVPAFQTAIDNQVATGTTGGGRFVDSARQAFQRYSTDGGASFVDVGNTIPQNDWDRFCSGQSYLPNTFGTGRGFVDEIYITGEESGTTGILFALDINNADLYTTSGYTGYDGRGVDENNSGMPTDSWENAALVDTGETDHVALILSPDGGTQELKMYVGQKGLDATGQPSDSFLARNGLAFGSYFYLSDPTDAMQSGTITVSDNDAVNSGKLEDVDTNPNDPTQFVLADQTSGTYVFDLDLDFTSGIFEPTMSTFELSKIDDQNPADADNLNNADNIDWTEATTLGGVMYDDGLIFVNEDNGLGQTWMMRPDGSEQMLVADTNDPLLGQFATESSGILDISDLMGYLPGSILLVDAQGSGSTMNVLINPNAALVPEPTTAGLLGLASLAMLRRRR